VGPRQQVNFRLSDLDLERLDEIVSSGAAKDRTEAIRVALAVAPMGLAAKLNKDIEQLARRTKRIAAQLEGLGYKDVQIAIDQEGAAKSRWRTDTQPRLHRKRFRAKRATS
jgi:hypothetical protein